MIVRYFYYVLYSQYEINCIITPMKLIVGILILSSLSLASLAQSELTIYFSFDKADFAEKYKKALKRYVSLNPGVKEIRINGHCDSRGSNEYNIILSKNRAENVKAHLETLLPKNVSLVVAFFGEENTVSIKHWRNRRVIVTTKTSPRKTQNDLANQQETTNEGDNTNTTSANNTAEASSKETRAIKKLSIEEFVKGKNIVLPEVHFVGGQHIFLPGADRVLTDLAKIMQENPTMKIEIQGHICCSPEADEGYDFGTKKFELSQTRAKAVFEFLVNQGIKGNRMAHIGLARKFPIVEVEITEEDKTTNRRVEIKITDI